MLRSLITACTALEQGEYSGWIFRVNIQGSGLHSLRQRQQEGRKGGHWGGWESLGEGEQQIVTGDPSGVVPCCSAVLWLQEYSAELRKRTFHGGFPIPAALPAWSIHKS